MSVKSKIYDLQWEALELIKEETKELLGPISPELREYYYEYKNEFQSYKAVSSKEELINSALKADIIYCGDYHTLALAQETFLSILEEVYEKNKNVVVGLEMIHRKHQNYLDKYIEGKIGDKKFLESVEYQKRWGFNWENYRIITDFARENGVKTVALNCDYGLEEDQMRKRDECTAETLAEWIEKYKNHKFIILYGDLHLAQNHLPARVDEKLPDSSLEKLIVYQNSESIFKKLHKQGKIDETDIVKIEENVYSIQNVLPWIKLQTYINWIEHEDELLKNPPLCQYFDSCEVDRNVTFDDEVFDDMKTIQKLLNLSDDLNFSDFSVYSLQDMSFVGELDVTAERYENIEKIISMNKSLFLPDDNIIYLSRLHRNYAVEEAGEYIFYITTGYPLKSPETFEAFYTRVLSEAFGFLCSKLVNPKRKAPEIIDYKHLLSEGSEKLPERRLKIMKKVADYILLHNRFSGKSDFSTIPDSLKRVSRDDLRNFLHISTELGHLLGNRLYTMYSDGKFTENEIKELLYSTDLEKKMVPFSSFLDLWDRSFEFAREERMETFF